MKEFGVIFPIRSGCSRGMSAMSLSNKGRVIPKGPLELGIHRSRQNVSLSFFSLSKRDINKRGRADLGNYLLLFLEERGWRRRWEVWDALGVGLSWRLQTSVATHLLNKQWKTAFFFFFSTHNPLSDNGKSRQAINHPTGIKVTPRCWKEPREASETWRGAKHSNHQHLFQWITSKIPQIKGRRELWQPLMNSRSCLVRVPTCLDPNSNIFFTRSSFLGLLEMDFFFDERAQGKGAWWNYSQLSGKDLLEMWDQL